MTDAPNGILAIWCDAAPGREADLDAWLQKEHLAERLAVPGFRLGRRYEALSGTRKFFIYYETDAPEVLSSNDYLDRLNDPTPWTRTIMSEVFRNMVRTACRRAYRRGAYRGPYAITAHFEARQDEQELATAIDACSTENGFACGEIWSAVNVGVSPTEEEKLRGGDRTIATCILIETLRQADAESAASSLTQRFKSAADTGIFRLLCERRPNGRMVTRTRREK
jgi:hypothetical protein